MAAQAKWQPLKTLSGMCFLWRDEKGRSQYQGIIHGSPPETPGLVLVQYFDALLGMPNTLALVPLADMINSDHSNPGYLLFENDEHLRDYQQTWQNARDRRIDAQEEKNRS